MKHVISSYMFPYFYNQFLTLFVVFVVNTKFQTVKLNYIVYYKLYRIL